MSYGNPIFSVAASLYPTEKMHAPSTSRVERTPSNKLTRSEEAERAGSSASRRLSKLPKELEEKLKLTTPQIKLVRKAWATARAGGEHEPGHTILQHVFFLNRDIKVIFGFDDSPGNDSHFSMRMRVHGVAFTNVLDDFIRNLEHYERVVPKIRELGRRHVHLREHGFKPALWNTFSQAIIDQTLQWGDMSSRTMETQVAWMEIVMFLISKMKEGYYEECRRLRKEIKQTD